jgi:hypothetical protein
MCYAKIDIIQTHQGCTDEVPHTETVSNAYRSLAKGTNMNIVTQTSCMK